MERRRSYFKNWLLVGSTHLKPSHNQPKLNLYLQGTVVFFKVDLNILFLGVNGILDGTAKGCCVCTDRGTTSFRGITCSGTMLVDVFYITSRELS